MLVVYEQAAIEGADSSTPQRLGKETGMLPKKQNKAYNDFYDSARHNEFLEPKTTVLIHLATAMAVGCYP